MSAFDDLKARYFFLGTSGGSFSSGTPGIPEFTGCDVIPHIGGPDYFRLVKAHIDQPDVKYIYVAGWWLDVNCDMVAGSKWIDVLKGKAAAGIDVRILGWVMPPSVLNNPAVRTPAVAGSLADMLRVNLGTMGFIQAARTAPALADKAILNVLSHPAGAVHTKLTLVGRDGGDVGFTGGIDPQQGRNTPMWHDVQAEVKGPAVQAMYDWYRAMWNENQGRSPATVSIGSTSLTTRSSSTPALAARTIPAFTAGTKHVQSARTVPLMNFSTMGSIGASIGGMSLPSNDPLSFATSGLFEIKQIWQKGVSGAQTYIYMEDQAFTSNEIFDWVNAALKANTALKAVFLIGADDPTAPNPGPMTTGFHLAVNQHLLSGLSQPDIDNRIGMFMHNTKVIHTKSTIVDDNWAIIGSANMMRRSLYTDMEHSVGWMDEAGTGVAGYRRDLWAVHHGSPQPALATDIARWFAIPFRGASATGRAIDRVRIPFTTQITQSSRDQTLMDQLLDVDSRDAWGSGLLSLAMSANTATPTGGGGGSL